MDAVSLRLGVETWCVDLCTQCVRVTEGWVTEGMSELVLVGVAVAGGRRKSESALSVQDVLQRLRPQTGEVDLLVQLFIQLSDHGTGIGDGERAVSESMARSVQKAGKEGKCVHVVSANDVETQRHLLHALG